MSIKVLVVDDSPVMREVISEFLNTDLLIRVIGTAGSGLEAMQMLETLKPDCVILDLVMPDMDGYATLKEIMKTNPVPVIIFSAHSRKDVELAFKCLAEGAVSIIPKPADDPSWTIEKAKNMMLAQIKFVSGIKEFKVKLSNKIKTIQNHADLADIPRVVVMGATTGGPQTIEALLSLLPKDFPIPIVIVQPMPTIFLSEFIARLNKKCELNVKVIENDDFLEAGNVYCLPQTYTVAITQQDNKHQFVLKSKSDDNQENFLDDCMSAIAQVYLENTIGVILSGSGHDGVLGAEAIKSRGGKVIVQDDALFKDLPNLVIKTGNVDLIRPMEDISAGIIELLTS